MFFSANGKRYAGSVTFAPASEIDIDVVFYFKGYSKTVSDLHSVKSVIKPVVVLFDIFSAGLVLLYVEHGLILRYGNNANITYT